MLMSEHEPSLLASAAESCRGKHQHEPREEETRYMNSRVRALGFGELKPNAPLSMPLAMRHIDRPRLSRIDSRNAQVAVRGILRFKLWALRRPSPLPAGSPKTTQLI